MINVIAPPGCYGTYIARCIHHYTSADDDHLLDFDTHGSSHAFRQVRSSIRKTSLTHWQPHDVQLVDGSNTIIVTGDSEHWLDYYDNQFYKNDHGNLVKFLTTSTDVDTIQDRLQHGWQYIKKLDNDITRWIIREYCSFWLMNYWQEGYDNSQYLARPHIYNFSCQELWHIDMWELVNIIGQTLKQNIYATKDIVYKNHQIFLKCQMYHNMQLRCNQFVNDTLDFVHSVSPCVSVFDEAYVQYLLRNQGYEMLCQDLNQFPTTSTQLAKIIYETSNNNHPR